MQGWTGMDIIINARARAIVGGENIGAFALMEKHNSTL
jgi:hypothetical protein